MILNILGFLVGVATALFFICLILLWPSKWFFWRRRKCSWKDKLPTKPLEEVRQEAGICTRQAEHTGPCNGFPRVSCPGYLNWLESIRRAERKEMKEINVPLCYPSPEEDEKS